MPMITFLIPRGKRHRFCFGIFYFVINKIFINLSSPGRSCCSAARAGETRISRGPQPGRPAAPSDQALGRGPPGWHRRDREEPGGTGRFGTLRVPPGRAALNKHGGRSVAPTPRAKPAALSKDGGAARPFPDRLRGAGDPLGTGAETPAPARPAGGLCRSGAALGPAPVARSAAAQRGPARPPRSPWRSAPQPTARRFR